MKRESRPVRIFTDKEGNIWLASAYEDGEDAQFRISADQVDQVIAWLREAKVAVESGRAGELPDESDAPSAAAVGIG